MEPHLPVPPVVGDHRAWPTRSPQALPAYGVGLNPGQILTQTIDVWRKNAGVLLALSAFPYFLMILAMVGLGIGAYAVGLNFDGVMEGHISPSVIGLAVGGVVVLLFSMVAMTAGQAGSILVLEDKLRDDSRAIGFGGAMMAGLSHVLPFACAYFLYSCVAMLMMSPAIGAGVAVATEHYAAGVGLGILAFAGFAGFVYVSLRIFAFAPAVVVEELGPIAAIKRSFELTSGRVTDVFLSMLVLGGVYFAINIGTSILGIIPILGALLQMGISMVMVSFQVAYMFHVYAGLRDAESER